MLNDKLLIYLLYKLVLKMTFYLLVTFFLKKSINFVKLILIKM